MTIYEALKDKLGREPTHAELKADVARIISEALLEVTTRRKERARSNAKTLDYMSKQFGG